MAKAATLQAQVAAVAAKVDRGDLADLLASKVRALLAVAERARLSRLAADAAPKGAEPEPASDWTRSRPSAGADKVRRKARKVNRWDKVAPLVSSASASGLRRGTKRWHKLSFVLSLCKEEGDVRVRNLLGKQYDPDSGDTLDGHDINGMAERGHIKIGD